MAKKIIMIVDDEVNILKVVEDILEPEGYNVVKANSGFEALKILKKIKPDLILVDYYMPEMSGVELCEKIRADSKLKDIKLAFLTVGTFSLVSEKYLERMDVIDIIKKPFEYKDIISRVKKIIG